MEDQDTDKKRMYMRRKAQMYRARDKAAASTLREEAYALEFDLHRLQHDRRPESKKPWREVAESRMMLKNEAVTTNETLKQQIQDNIHVIEQLLAKVHDSDAFQFQTLHSTDRQNSKNGMHFRLPESSHRPTRETLKTYLPPLHAVLSSTRLESKFPFTNHQPNSTSRHDRHREAYQSTSRQYNPMRLNVSTSGLHSTGFSREFAM